MFLASLKPSIWHFVLLGLAVRLCVLFIYPDQRLPDADLYMEAGTVLFKTGILGTEKYMALFPILTYLTGGEIGLKIFDIALSIFTIWVVYKLSLLIFRHHGAALLAAFLMAVYPYFAFYAVSRLSETSYLFANCLAFLLFYRNRFWMGSIVLVLSLHLRPTADLLAPLLILSFALIVHGASWRSAGLHLLRYGLVYLVLMMPWWFHNYVKYDTFVRLNVGDGIVLYSGNNEHNKSGGGVANNLASDDMNMEKFKAIKDPVERNNALKAAAIQFIKDNPDRFVELAVIKFVRFWRLWPYAPEYQKPIYIVSSLASYGVVLFFCLLGLWRGIARYWRPLAPVLLFTAYLTAVHMATIGSIRYRLPVEPFMIVIAAWGIADMAKRWGWSGKYMKWLGSPNS